MFMSADGHAGGWRAVSLDPTFTLISGCSGGRAGHGDGTQNQVGAAIGTGPSTISLSPVGSFVRPLACPPGETTLMARKEALN